jgi:hypothetical protein
VNLTPSPRANPVPNHLLGRAGIACLLRHEQPVLSARESLDVPIRGCCHDLTLRTTWDTYLVLDFSRILAPRGARMREKSDVR